MASMVPYGSSLEENVAYRIAAKLDRIDQGLFWVVVGRVFGLNLWYVWVGDKGRKDPFLEVMVDRRLVGQPLSWSFSFQDEVHENDSFSCPTLGVADVEHATSLMINYIGMLF